MMKKKINIVVLLVTVCALTLTSAVSAEENAPEGRVRLFGQVTHVDAATSSFEMETRSGENKTIIVNEGTKYRSPGGKIQNFDDLARGMQVIVIAVEQGNGTILAKIIGAANFAPERDAMRVIGEITGVVVTNGSFSLRARDDRILRFETDERTRYRSQDGAIEGLEDLEPGMKALVVARQSEEGSPVALLVAAGTIDDLPPIRQYKGEVSSVNPGQGLFIVLTEDDHELEFKISERTKFRSPDGDITSVSHLRSGMRVQIGAIVNEDGELTPLIIIAGSPQRPLIDVKTGGRIVKIYGSSFTIEMRSGETRSFVVDTITRYTSKDGSVKGFDDLEVGMIAFVGGESLDTGEVTARWIGAGHRGRDGGVKSSTPSFDLESGFPR
jgi:hypothetical protein